jgi:hypothetical protein
VLFLGAVKAKDVEERRQRLPLGSAIEGNGLAKAKPLRLIRDVEGAL